MQSFRSRNAIYRRGTTSTLHDPQDYSSYEGVLEPEGPGIWFDPEIGNDPCWQKRWKSTARVELRLTATRIVFLRRGGAGGPGGPLASVSARSGLRPPLAARTFAACQHLLAARARSSCGTRSLSPESLLQESP